MESVYQGILLGLSLSVLIGPIFVGQSQITLAYGLRSGMMFNLGIWLSDVLISFGSYIFVRELRDLINHPDFRWYMGIAGVVVLASIGFGLMFRKYNKEQLEASFSIKKGLNHMMKGFLINTINPFTFIFWISVCTTYILAANATNAAAMTLIVTILLMIVITDSIKVYFAKRLKNILTPPTIVKLSQISGGLLVILSFVLFWRISR
jgi:threonine/homoserine/homoserine lactone efflux protein